MTKTTYRQLPDLSLRLADGSMQFLSVEILKNKPAIPLDRRARGGQVGFYSRQEIQIHASSTHRCDGRSKRVRSLQGLTQIGRKICTKEPDQLLFVYLFNYLNF